MPRAVVLVAVLPLACTMPNPAFEDGRDDAAAGTDASELESSESPESSSDAPTSEATSDPSTSDPSDSSTSDPSDTDPSDSSTSEGETAGENCGNGLVDPGEACDDGNTNEDDECTSACSFPICGDGILSGVEECDDGNIDPTDDCLPNCVPASCGDGFVHVGAEQCEADGDDGCIGCIVSFRRVFVTSELYVGGALGGLEGADAICNEHAASAGLGGEFKAWLSSDGESPSTRFTTWEVPYVLPNDPMPELVSGWIDLVDGSPLLLPIVVTESGTPLLAGAICSESDRVWTGTKADGLAHAQHCSGFTTSNAIGALGAASSFMSWTLCNPMANCATAARLYCFQQ
jgi:cysteine-rich repeat protein